MSLFLVLIGAWTGLPGPWGGNCRSIDVNPADRAVLLCCTWNGSHGGVFRSSDAGASWLPVNGIGREHGAGMNVVRFCPSAPEVAVCGSKSIGSNGLYLSTDGGLNWRQTGFLPGYANDIVWHPGGRDTFYVVSGTGLQRTTDQGASWQQLFGRTYCWQAGFRPGSDETLFVGGLYGLYRSFDGGATWDTSGFGRRCYDFAFDPTSPDTLYVAAHVYGVFKVWDNGDAWDSLGNADHYNTTIRLDRARDEIWTGGFAFSPKPGRICLSTDMGESWQEFGPDRLPDLICHDIGLVPGDTVLYAAGEYFGPMRFNRREGAWVPSAVGMAEANVRAVWLGPGDVVYAAGSVIGVSRSDDDGRTWRMSLGTPVCGIPHDTEMWPPGLVCSPTCADSVYACFQGHVPYVDSVFRSTNGGQDWFGTQVPGLAQQDRLNLLAVHPAGPETLYLSSTAGVHKSTDAGQTWYLVDSLAAYCVAVDRHSPATIYSGWIGRARRSTDAGATWQDFSTGLPQWSEAMNIVSDPDSAGLLYVAMCGGEARDPLSGIYVYREAVGSWERKSAGLPGTFVLRPRLALDTVADCLWTALPNQGAQLYRSTDRGETWQAADSGFVGYGAYFVTGFDGAWLGTRADGLWRWEGQSGVRGQPAACPRPGLATVFAGSLDLPSGWERATLHDASGRLVASDVSGAGRSAVAALRPGVYFLRSAGQSVKTVKVR